MAIADRPLESEYVVVIHPGDVGTAGGVVIDDRARVRRGATSLIPERYAAGTATASVFGRCYLAAGAGIAAPFTFGGIAGLHMAGPHELVSILAREMKIDTV